ncbi:MAG TPA: protein TolA, partial [Paracoccus sp. (in: a-proteobacteria)]|nr:protein TolA [Paracoccus sp. (in: a-proteobacteria)]
MADPFPPGTGREARIGAWISGAVHAALIGWLALGGALFRPQPAPAIRMSEVQTMSEAEFQALAAASRGAGPVGEQASAPPAQPRTPADEVVAGGPAEVAPPAPDADPEALPAPLQAREAAPNLSDVTRPQTPVEVATIAPAPRQPGEGEPAPAAPAPVPPAARPVTPAAPAGAADGTAPRIATAPAPVLTDSQAPFDVAGARTRLADRQAAARAETLARA